MKPIHLGNAGRASINLDVARLIDTRLLVCANSGAGKSYLLRGIAEQAAPLIPTIVFDPEGEFVTLREGIDAVLVSRDGGDVLTDPKSAALLARKLLELGLCAVIDLSDLKVAERRRYVRLFMEAVMAVPKKLWRPTLLLLDEAHQFCLDEETEILSQKGWRRWDQIEQGSEVITFDPENETYQIEQVQRLIVHDHDGPMISVEQRGLSMLMTPDHRVVLQRTQRAPGRYGKTYPWCFCPAGDLPQQFHVPIGGAPEGPGIDGVDPSLLRVIGWILTDGYRVGRKGYRYGIGIEQSVATYKYGRHMVAEMEAVLTRLFPDVTVSHRDRSGCSHTIDGHDAARSPSMVFYIGVESAAEIFRLLRIRHGSLQHGSRRRIPRQLIERPNREQLSALYQGLLEGDGGSAFFPGKSEGLADDFQEVATRLGICANKSHQGSNQWKVTIPERERFYVREKSAAHYRGKVWDVTVPSGAFIARRNGTVFVTGNCPEKGQAESMDAVIALMSQGRKRGFCGVLATQRLSKLHKDAAAEANNLLIGRTTLDLDLRRACDLLQKGKADWGTLQTLDPGEFFAFGPALSVRGITRLRTARVTTTHPESGRRHALEAPKPSARIRKVLPEFDDLPERAAAEAKTLEEARTRIRQLEREARRSAKGQPGAAPNAKQQQAVATLRAERDAARASQKAEERLRLAVERRLGTASKALSQAQTALDRLGTVLDRAPEPAQPPRVEAPPANTVSRALVRTERETSANGALGTGGKRRMMVAIAQMGEDGCDRVQLGLLAGMSQSGTFSKYLSVLRGAGYVVEDGSRLLATSEGIAAAGDYQPLPTGGDLADYWLGRMGHGGKRRLLEALLEAGPEGLTRDALAEAAGLSAGSGTFSKYLSVLRGLKLAQGKDTIRPAETLL